MLQTLFIQNYALIDHLQINFEDGFSVITGETGSGKSILLGALGLILGDRSDFTSIRNKDKKCVVEGVFLIREEDHGSYFKRHDLDYATETIIRREISPSGKSRAFINDTPVSLSVLKEIGGSLIDIHSQHETLLINNHQFLLGLLDAQHNKIEELKVYRQKFRLYSDQKKELNDLKIKDTDAQNQRDFISFLINEFEEFDLKTLADNNIEEEYQVLSNAEEIKRSLNLAFEGINGEANSSALGNLKSVKNELLQVAKLSPKFEELANRLESIVIELKDISDDCDRLSETVELDEKKLLNLESQISFVNRLLHKHQLTNIGELIKKYTELKQEISAIDNLSDQITLLEKDLEISRQELLKSAGLISKERKNIAKELETRAKSYLEQMNMKHAEVEFRFEDLEEFNKDGIDQIQLYVKTNLGGKFEPLKKVASGGETSRIMLAIKALQSEKRSLPTIIFDEIDTGVSGEVAKKMGGIMSELGSKMQVLSITHLPQIAAQGNHHYRVSKIEHDHSTITTIEHLTDKERESEIAQLLSGSDISGAALKNAQELLKAK